MPFFLVIHPPETFFRTFCMLYYVTSVSVTVPSGQRAAQGGLTVEEKRTLAGNAIKVYLVAISL
jgi:hypothetical protein